MRKQSIFTKLNVNVYIIDRWGSKFHRQKLSLRFWISYLLPTRLYQEVLSSICCTCLPYPYYPYPPPPTPPPKTKLTGMLIAKWCLSSLWRHNLVQWVQKFCSLDPMPSYVVCIGRRTWQSVTHKNLVIVTLTFEYKVKYLVFSHYHTSLSGTELFCNMAHIL